MNDELIINSPRPSATFTHRAGPGAGTTPGGGGDGGSNTGAGGNVLGPLPVPDATWLLVLLIGLYLIIKTKRRRHPCCPCPVAEVAPKGATHWD